MDSNIAIRVDGLGKKYVIGHQAAERGGTLRDALMRGAGNFGRMATAMLNGAPMVAGDETEDFWALRDVDFEIRRGDVVGVIGRNGAGKSTLLKVLSRITEPTTGRVQINGRMTSLLEVGTGFHPELSGRENVFLNGAILGMTRREIQRKFDEIVDFAEVERFLDTPVKRYSSGMYVRLAFAVAAHLEPEILVIDEVLAVGDQQFQKKCLGKMEDVGKDGRTVIFVSHNMAAIRQLCGSSLLMHGGRLLAQCDSVSALSMYMDQGANKEGFKEWPSGVGTSIKLLAVEVCDKGMTRKVEFASHEPIHIFIRYRVERRLVGAKVGFRLSTHDGTFVFTSEDGDSIDDLGTREPGVYEARTTIEGDFLNQGEYFVGAVAHVPMIEVLFIEDNALSFSVKNIDGVGGFVDDGRRGVIRPRLKWEISTAG